ncbi:MAG: LysR family transcriptional regulator [Myxococcota bacterium]
MNVLNPDEVAPLGGLDLNLLVILRVLLDESSVTRTAQLLGSTQPTISRVLTHLRGAFDDPLLVRQGRSMILTPFAESLRDPLAQALASVEGLRQLGDFNPQTHRRHFRVVLPDLLDFGTLARICERTADTQRVTLTIMGVEGDALRGLLTQEVDLVVTDRPFEHADLRARAVHPSSGWSLLVGNNHPSERALTLDEWLEAKHIQLVPGGNPSASGLLDRYLRAQGLRRRVSMHVSYLSALPTILASTDLVCTLPTPPAAFVANTGIRMHPHPLEHEIPASSIWVSWHSRFQRDAGHRWLRRLVVDCLEETLRSLASSLPRKPDTDS